MTPTGTSLSEAAARGRKRHRRFALAVAAMFFGVLCVFATVNTRINPLWVTQTPWTDPAFAPYREIYRNTRTAKAGLLRADEWETLTLGSSRIAIAMDPTFPEWGDHKVLNLGLSASTLTENKLVIDYILKHKPSVRNIILGVDLNDVSSKGDSTRSSGFDESPFNPKGDPTERELRYIFGVSTFKASVRSITTKSKKGIPPYTELGHWAHHRTHGAVRKMIEVGTIPGAKRFAANLKVSSTPNPDKIRLLGEAIRACRDHGVKLTVIAPPNHVAYMSVPVIDGAPDPFLFANRRALQECVAQVNAERPDFPPVVVWDFNDLHPINCERLPEGEAPDSQMHYWVDGIHAKETIGHIMLARVLGWPMPDPAGADYGVRLDQVDPAEHERRIEEEFRRYQEANPVDWKWIEAKTHSSDSDAKNEE